MAEGVSRTLAIHARDARRVALRTVRGETWTYRKLADGVDSLRGLLGSALTPAEPIAIMMTGAAEPVAVLLAAEASGHLAALVSPSLRPEELRSLLVECGAGFLVAPRDIDLPMLGKMSAAPLTTGGLRWIAIPGGGSERKELRAQLPIGSFIAQLTSGSTGASRWALRTGAAVQAEIAAVAERLALHRGDRVLCASSPAHSYGLIGGLLAPLIVGARVILAPGAAALRTAAREKPSIVFGLPDTYRALLDDPLLDGVTIRDRLSTVRHALSAGVPLPQEIFSRVLETAGLPIRQDYGTTETGTISIDAPEANPGTVGRPLSHMEVRIATPDGATEVWVRSRAVAAGYILDGAVVPCTDAAGWYHTRDAGSFDPAGRLRLYGRLRDPIVVGGLDVYPDRIETVIRALPGVREVAVLPVVAAGGRGAVKAVVVAPELDVDAITAWCLVHLVPEQRPSTIELRTELPRSPAGKILQKYMA